MYAAYFKLEYNVLGYLMRFKMGYRSQSLVRQIIGIFSSPHRQQAVSTLMYDTEGGTVSEL